MNFNKRYIALFLSIAFLGTLFLTAPCLASSGDIGNPQKETRIYKKANASFLKLANRLNEKLCLLATKLNEQPLISIRLNSHFYDKRIRRYFFSFSGQMKYLGAVPFKITSSHYYISSEGVTSYDVELKNIEKTRLGLHFNFSGVVIISFDDLVYKMLKDIPNLAAAKALSPATDLLTNFFKNLNVGMISKAVSKTIVKFSRQSLIQFTTDVVIASSHNKSIKKFVASSVKDHSILSFLGITIVKAALSSGMGIYGSSLGAAVGSVISPGAGTVIGAFLGHRITSMIASAIVYRAMVKLPIKHALKRILKYQRVLSYSPSDSEAQAKVEDNIAHITRVIKSEFNHNKFSAFDLVLKKIDSCDSADRIYFVSLLKALQSILNFKILNEGDWYYAKRYYRLKMFVQKWGLSNKVRFNTKSK